MTTVDYYFTTGSPWTYLGHPRFAEILQRHGARVNVKPVDYGRVFPVSGGLPLKQRAPQRQAYRMMELKRWRDHLGVPITLEPRFFPFDFTPSAKTVIAADLRHGAEAAMRLAFAFMRGCWAEERNMADADAIAAVVREQGLDPMALASAAGEASARYDAYTQEAIDRGVFGAPSFVVDAEIFWGQDRLDFLDRKLAS